MKKIYILVTIFFLSVSTVFAQYPNPSSTTQGILSAFRMYKEVGSLQIVVPTVVELPFSEFMEREHFALYNKTAGGFEPFYFRKQAVNNEVAVQAEARTAVGQTDGYMVDKNPQTFAEFLVTSDGQNTAQIILFSNTPVTSSTLTVLLDNYVALPNYVQIQAQVAGQNKIVVANRVMSGNTINFPKTTSSLWTITFTFGQPLRISELNLQQEGAFTQNTKGVRFLAQPGNSYQVYFDADRYVAMRVGEAGNLAGAESVMKLPVKTALPNPGYVIADTDGDNIPDIRDNCVTVPNADQKDVNGNGRGDVCDDFDQDSIANSTDNCPNNPNINQSDDDGDGIGDVCDNEESRITEKHKWIPWAGIGLAVLVLIGLLILTIKSPNKNSEIGQ